MLEQELAGFCQCLEANVVEFRKCRMRLYAHNSTILAVIENAAARKNGCSIKKIPKPTEGILYRFPITYTTSSYNLKGIPPGRREPARDPTLA
jgi:hypothetical protein